MSAETESPTTPTTPSSSTTTSSSSFLTESVPRGFHNAIEVLNSLPESIVDEMAYKILLNINRQTMGVEVDEIVHKLEFDFKLNLQQVLFKQQLKSQKLRTTLQRELLREEQNLQELNVGQEIQNVLNVISYIYKSAIRSSNGNDNDDDVNMFAKSIRKQTQMSVHYIRILQVHWMNYLKKNKKQSSSSSSTDQIFNLQKLKGMDWKLSVSMASFCCEQLNDAKVTLIFTLDQSTNDKHTVELSLEEFKQFYSSFAEMANLLQTL